MTTDNKVQGDLRSFSIFDITQTLLSGRKTAYVTVNTSNQHGFLYFSGGQIVYAVDDRMNTGEKAVFSIFTWRRGTFSIDFDRRTQEKNITAPTDYLLLEVARNLDEVTHEQSDANGETSQEAVSETVEERLETSLKQKLTTIFQKVADKAEPTRDRYTRHAFDGLLRAMFEMKGTALFVRRGKQPRVKTPDGFNTMKDAVFDENEVDGFLMALLSEAEMAQLRADHEVSTVYAAAELGRFIVDVLEEDGSPTIIMAPARSEVASIETFGLGRASEEIMKVVDGLILVSGPLGSGKSNLLATLVAHHAGQRDKCVAFHTDERVHALETTGGFVIRHKLPAGGAALEPAIRSSLVQGADVLAVDPVVDRQDLGVVLEVAATGRLTLASIACYSMAGTLSLLQSLTADAQGDRITRLLAEHLRAILALGPRRTNEPPAAEVLLIGRDEQVALRKRDFAHLRAHQVVSSL